VKRALVALNILLQPRNQEEKNGAGNGQERSHHSSPLSFELYDTAAVAGGTSAAASPATAATAASPALGGGSGGAKSGRLCGMNGTRAKTRACW